MARGPRPEAHHGPSGPIMAHQGPSGPIMAHHGPSWPEAPHVGVRTWRVHAPRRRQGAEACVCHMNRRRDCSRLDDEAHVTEPRAQGNGKQMQDVGCGNEGGRLFTEACISRGVRLAWPTLALTAPQGALHAYRALHESSQRVCRVATLAALEARVVEYRFIIAEGWIRRRTCAGTQV